MSGAGPSPKTTGAPTDAPRELAAGLDDLRLEPERVSERLAAKLAEPRRDRSDELLADLPAGDHHLGRLAGYRAGRTLRRRLGWLMGAVLLLIVAVSVRYQLQLREERARAEYERLHPWSLPAGSDTASRPRTISWTSGKARLALSAEPPGANRIELPDRVIELAEGHDHAQVKFEVRQGRTVDLVVLSGEVVQRPRDAR